MIIFSLNGKVIRETNTTFIMHVKAQRSTPMSGLTLLLGSSRLIRDASRLIKDASRLIRDA